MASGPLTPAQFRVDLSQLNDAISAVQTQAGLIGFRTALITGMLQGVGKYWSTPAEIPFNDLQQACTTQMTALNDLLTQMLTRMRTTYQNYHDAEQANVGNFHR